MDTDIIKYIITSGLIAVLVPIALIYFKIHAKEPMSDNTFRQSKKMLVFSLFGFLIVLSAAIVATFGLDSLGWPWLIIVIFYYCFALCVLWLFLSALNYRLILDEDCLTYINFLNVKRQYNYREITRVIGYYNKNNNTLEKYIICIGEKKIEINHFYGDLNVFLTLIKKRLKKSGSRLKIEYIWSRI